MAATAGPRLDDPEVAARFIDALAATTNVAVACRASGVTIGHATAARKRLPGIAAAWAAARGEGVRVVTKNSAALRRRFLLTLATCGCASSAARAAGVSLESIYILRRTDAAFAAAWAEARSQALDLAEGVLIKGAIFGHRRTETIGEVTKVIVDMQPKITLALLDRARPADAPLRTASPERVAAARARMIEILVSGAGLRSMDDHAPGLAAAALAAPLSPPVAS